MFPELEQGAANLESADPKRDRAREQERKEKRSGSQQFPRMLKRAEAGGRSWPWPKRSWRQRYHLLTSQENLGLSGSFSRATVWLAHADT